MSRAQTRRDEKWSSSGEVSKVGPAPKELIWMFQGRYSSSLAPSQKDAPGDSGNMVPKEVWPKLN